MQKITIRDMRCIAFYIVVAVSCLYILMSLSKLSVRAAFLVPKFTDSQERTHMLYSSGQLELTFIFSQELVTTNVRA